MSSKGSKETKFNILSIKEKESIQKLMFINEIIKLNIENRQLKTITEKDLSIFSFFFSVSNNILNNLQIIALYPQHLNLNCNKSQKRTYLSLEQLLISITYVYFILKFPENEDIYFYNNIFSLISKINENNLLTHEQIILFIKYLIILSFINPKSSTLLIKDKPLYNLTFYNLSINLIITIQKSSNPLDNSEMNQIFNFINSKLTNLNSLHKLRNSSIMLKLLNIENINNNQSLFSLLNKIYLFNYSVVFNEVFMEKIQYSLENLNKENIMINLKKDISSLITHCDFLRDFHQKEIEEKQRDKYINDIAFVFNDNDNSGLEYEMTKEPKSFALIFSFNLWQMKNNTEYPILCFQNKKNRETLFKVFVLNGKLYIKSAKTQEDSVNIETNKTYLACFEYDIKLFKDILSLRIASSESQMKVSEIKTFTFEKAKINGPILCVGYEKKDKNTNFVGTIGTILFFKKKIGTEITHLFHLNGSYSRIPFLSKVSKFEQVDKYLPLQTKKKQEKFKYSYNFFIKNIEYCIFCLSPLSMIQRNMSIPLNDIKESTNEFYFKQALFFKNSQSKKKNRTKYFKSFSPPEIDAMGTYAISNNTFISEFLKNDGISLMILHLEYYYNILRLSLKEEQYNEILQEISNGIGALLKLATDIFTSISYENFIDEFDSFGFSLAKVINLLCDVHTLMNNLTTILIEFFIELCKVFKENNYSDVFIFKLFYFIIEPSRYDFSFPLIISKIFKGLNYCLSISTNAEQLMNNKTLLKLFQVSFILDVNLLDAYSHNKHPTSENNTDYIQMKKEYINLISIFIKNSFTNDLLLDYLDFIFEHSKNNTFKSFAIQYFLLKIFYEERNLKLEIDTSISSSSNDSISSIGDKSKSSLKEKEISFSNIQRKLLEKCIQYLLKIKDSKVNIKDDKDRKYYELTRSVLILLIFEEYYKGDTVLTETAIVKTSKNSDNLNNSIKQLSMKTLKNIFTKDKSVKTGITSVENEEKKNIVNFFGIEIDLPLSIYIVKVIFCCLNELWDEKERISFLEKDGYEGQLLIGKVEKVQKQIMCQYIKIMKVLEGTLQYQAHDLFATFCIQVIKNYLNQAKNQWAMCLFFHLFESKTVMNAFFISWIEKVNEFQNLYNIMLTIIFKCFKNHQKNFVISFIKECIRGKYYQISFVISKIFQFYSMYILAKDLINPVVNVSSDESCIQNEADAGDGDIITAMLNLNKFITCIRENNARNPLIMKKMFSIDDTMLYSISSFYSAIFQSSFILDMNIYYSASYLQKKNKVISRFTLYEGLLDLLFSISRLSEVNGDVNGMNIDIPINLDSPIKKEFSIDTDFTITNASTANIPINTHNANNVITEILKINLPKIIYNDHSICFNIDLFNPNILLNKEGYKEKLLTENFQIKEEYISLISDYGETKQKNKSKTKIEQNLYGNMLKIPQTRLMTLKTYILCLKYFQTENNEKIINIATRDNINKFALEILKSDLIQIINYIDKFPTIHKEEQSIFNCLYLNAKNNHTLIIYDKILNHLTHNKNSVSLEEINNTIEVEEISTSKTIFNDELEPEKEIPSLRKDSFSFCGENCRKSISTPGTITKRPMAKSMPSFTIHQKSLNINYSLIDFNFKSSILCLKRDLLLKKFGLYFKEKFFENKKFMNMKAKFKYIYSPNDQKSCYNGEERQQSYLNFPSTLKNFSNFESFYPKQFLRPDLRFFKRKDFSVSHEYFIESKEGGNDYYIQAPHGLLFQDNFNFFSKKIQYPNATYETFEVEYIYNRYVIFGNLLVTSNFLAFQTKIPFDIQKEHSTNTKFLFSSLELDICQNRKQIIIKACDIETIVNRRFLFMNIAIEIFLKNGKSYFFNMLSLKEQKRLVKVIKELFPKIDIIENTQKLFLDKNYKTIWKQGFLDNFDYLLQINKCAERSYNDLNQYPILPWILLNFSEVKDKNSDFRILQYPMSAQSKDKQEQWKKLYRATNSMKFPVHFRIHYSNSSFIFTYLVRLAPFTYNQIKFQNGVLDSPNRQIHSFQEFSLLLQEVSDNRELIPEMYVMIEQLYNLNFAFFGKRNDNDMINNVITSASHTIPLFILFHRKLLNSDFVKDNINVWIDSYFGPKQTEFNELSLNVYPKETYEIYTIPKIKKIKEKYSDNKDLLISKVRQKISFTLSLGQAPMQLFSNNHLKFPKWRSNDKEDDFEIARKKIHYQTNKIIELKMKVPEVVILIAFTENNNKFYIVTHSSIYLFSKMILQEKVIDIEPLEPIDIFKINNSNQTRMIYKHTIFEHNDGELFFLSTYSDKSIKVYSHKKLISSVFCESKASCLIKLKGENNFYSGHKNGKILKWEYEIENSKDDQSFKIIQKEGFMAHYGEVKFMEISTKHKLLMSYGNEGVCIIRKLYDFEILSIIRTEQNEIYADVEISYNDFIYLLVYNVIHHTFHICAASFNSIKFQTSTPGDFLPFVFLPTTKEILYISMNNVHYVTQDLKKRKNIRNICELLNQLNHSKKKDEEVNIVAYGYDDTYKIVICALESGEVIRFTL